MGAEETRSRILNCTIELIRKKGGDINNVTIRTIADMAGVGVGLTNHYFKTKELLIAECVDEIFKDVFAAFIRTGDDLSPIEETKRAARNVMTFFIEHEALARVAIVNDENTPGREDYTTRLTNAFALCMVDRQKLEEMLLNDKISPKMKQQFRDHFISEQRRKAFMITASIKEAFIRKDFLRDTIGVDLNKPEQRDEYIDELVELLM